MFDDFILCCSVMSLFDCIQSQSYPFLGIVFQLIAIKIVQIIFQSECIDMFKQDLFRVSRSLSPLTKIKEEILIFQASKTNFLGKFLAQKAIFVIFEAFP